MYTIMDALNGLEEVVKEMGEDRTAFARYVDNGWHPTRPECIIGHAMHRAGVSLATMRDWGSRSPREIEFPFPITQGAREVLYAAQKAQDCAESDDWVYARGTWGEALSAALKAAERYLELIPDEAIAAALPEREAKRELVGV